MALNPAKQSEALNSPVERASKLNDPQFENQQGYFPYDLTHQEFITPRFGELTPSMHLITAPGDRTVVHDNTKLILNQINGNFLSNLNQYVDNFYVPLRNLIPNNYEKLIPNPVKGEDLPNAAHPMVPLLAFLRQFYDSSATYAILDDAGDPNTEFSLNTVFTSIIDSEDLDSVSSWAKRFFVSRLLLLTTILSRGQLLDYLGFQLDSNDLTVSGSILQKRIDAFQSALYNLMRVNYVLDNPSSVGFVLPYYTLDLTANELSDANLENRTVRNLSEYRAALSDIFEAGKFPLLPVSSNTDIEGSAAAYTAFEQATIDLLYVLEDIFAGIGLNDDIMDELDYINTTATPWESGTRVNISSVLAYQQVVAHYYSNDRVDNVYSSELFMQNLRSVMYPTPEGAFSTIEPTFEVNGVNYEYDYISYGGFISSLMYSALSDGQINRQWVFATMMFLLRRSLRYGDYFSNARPEMLAISDQLSIAVEGGQVSPMDVTKNLLLQRYLNAVNYSGQQFLNYMSSIFGVKPSDTGCIPRFISHRKIALQNQITNNTADNQGAQTTNIVGYSDASAFDVFIDDFGYLITIQSFDVLPIYKSGIDNSFYLADRFTYFNPMMQGIGDQPILSSELLGYPELHTDVFGYTMRNSEYKYKLSKAHGAFCNSLPGFMLSYPLNAYNEGADEYDININPDFIRDKPVYLDPVIPQMTGISPAEYFHFIVSCTNQVLCARKIQATPGVLF